MYKIMKRSAARCRPLVQLRGLTRGILSGGLIARHFDRFMAHESPPRRPMFLFFMILEILFRSFERFERSREPQDHEESSGQSRVLDWHRMRFFL